MQNNTAGIEIWFWKYLGQRGPSACRVAYTLWGIVLVQNCHLHTLWIPLCNQRAEESKWRGEERPWWRRRKHEMSDVFTGSHDHYRGKQMQLESTNHHCTGCRVGYTLWGIVLVQLVQLVQHAISVLICLCLCLKHISDYITAHRINCSSTQDLSAASYITVKSALCSIHTLSGFLVLYFSCGRKCRSKLCRNDREVLVICAKHTNTNAFKRLLGETEWRVCLQHTSPLRNLSTLR